MSACDVPDWHLFCKQSGTEDDTRAALAAVGLSVYLSLL